MCRFRADRSRGAAVLIVLVLTISGCGRTVRSPLDDEAGRYVRLAVALGERDPDSLDFYAGPADLVADLHRSPPPLPAIKREAETLSARVTRVAAVDPADAARARDLVGDLAAMAARIDLLTGTRLPYDTESRAFFGIAPGPIDERRLSDIRSEIADIVGRDGRLVDRYAAFAARFTIPVERLPAVMHAAVDECRRRTVAHLALPPGERVTLEFVREQPWSAFSRYLGDGRSVIQVNTDFRFTVDQALQVACHEGYPGHHTRNTLMASTSTSVARGFSPAGHRWPEHSVQLMFSPEALVSEASAMLAADVAFSPAERVRVERDRLFPLAGLRPAGAEQHIAIERMVGDLQVVQADVARRYLDGELEFVRAVTALEEQALVPHAEAMIKYVNEYRSYVTTYTVGRTVLAARLAACSGANPREDARWRCFEKEMLKRRL
jgi:hypothetical protein